MQISRSTLMNCVQLVQPVPQLKAVATSTVSPKVQRSCLADTVKWRLIYTKHTRRAYRAFKSPAQAMPIYPLYLAFLQGVGHSQHQEWVLLCSKLGSINRPNPFLGSHVSGTRRSALSREQQKGHEANGN